MSLLGKELIVGIGALIRKITRSEEGVRSTLRSYRRIKMLPEWFDLSRRLRRFLMFSPTVWGFYYYNVGGDRYVYIVRVRDFYIDNREPQ